MSINPCRRLLVISCSKIKRPSANLLPAVERYDGPAFKVYRKRRPTDSQIQLVILSSKYGFIPGNLLIANYDEIMPRHVDEERMAHYHEQISNLLRGRDFDTAFFCLGDRYRNCLPHLKALPVTVREIVFASGRIGERLRQLKQWLISCECHASE